MLKLPKISFPDVNSIKKPDKEIINVLICWINDKFKKENMNILIKKIEDLFGDKLYLAKLIDALWGGDVNDDLIEHSKRKQMGKNDKIEYVLDRLNRTKNIAISISGLDIYERLGRINISNCITLIWKIIYCHSVDWISFYGEHSINGLLKWCSIITKKDIKDIKVLNDSWKNEKIYYDIIKSSFPNISEDKILNLKDIGVPIYLNPKLMQLYDEKCIVLQCAELFNYSASLNIFQCKHNETDQSIDETISISPDLLEPDNSIDDSKLDIIDINKLFFPTIKSPKPILVSKMYKLNDEIKVDFYLENFKKAMQKAGSRPIIFVSSIGPFQTGKSTLISCFTGNLKLTIGNTIDEGTEGVYIVGPYELDYFYQRFKYNTSQDIYYSGNGLLAPLIYFFDIEGYGGKRHGYDIEAVQKAFNKMCTPFLCLSSIFLFIPRHSPELKEIKELIERVQISSLTTSDIHTSNGALSLLIVMNKSNNLVSTMNNLSFDNIKKEIMKEEELLHNEWIGSHFFENYGINFDFAPIVEISLKHVKDGSFYHSFQLFAHKVISNIEIATQANFMRCGIESCHLCEYILDNYENFGVDIKNKIAEFHEESFKTISEPIYQRTLTFISGMINDQFQKFEDNLKNNINDEIDISKITKKYIEIGNNEMKKAFYVVFDSKNVCIYIEKLMLCIQQQTLKKYNEYCENRNKKYDELYKCLEEEANKNLNLIIRNILHGQLHLNQDEIHQKVEDTLTNLKNQLREYKIQVHNELITNEMIDDIAENKKNMIEELINGINKKEEEEKMLQDEFSLKALLEIKENELISTIYTSIFTQKLIELNTMLKNKDYYLKYYQQIEQLADSIIDLIKNDLNSKSNQILTQSIQLLCEENIKNEEIIKRLKLKNEIMITTNQIQSAITPYLFSFKANVFSSFALARNLLKKVYKQTRNVPINSIKYTVEIQTIEEYPDGCKTESEWEPIRTETIQFSTFVENVIKSIGRIFSITLDMLERVARSGHQD